MLNFISGFVCGIAVLTLWAMHKVYKAHKEKDDDEDKGKGV